MRDITRHELDLITGNAEPTDEELAAFGFDPVEWKLKLRPAFTQAMQDEGDAEERARRVRHWGELDAKRREAKLAARRACRISIWARIHRGEIKNPFFEVRRFSRPIGRG